MRIADKLVTIAENMQIVYDVANKSGEEYGYDWGKRVGIEEGKKAQYDLFWDTFQKNGKRTDYRYAFANWDGCESIFKPKFDIKPEGAANAMFFDCQTFMSLPDVCKKQGIVMDFSKVTNFQSFLGGSCAIYHIGEVDCSSTTSMTLAFNQATSLKYIDKLILHEGITTYQDCFANTALLESITIEGTIAGTGFNVAAHKNLTHDSLMSIINALKNYSGTSTTKTITLGATNLAKLSDTEKAIATQKGWTLA